ncbi:MAG TPA: glycosyltransferase family 2 protein [Blastocatellia bacterium]|nr:glycosyltransferase family 2 protein [Blastocatellia bacterium]
MPRSSKKELSTKPTPRVSVIMSTFREVSDGLLADGTDSQLSKAIQSVIHQTLSDWELFVVSDHPPEADRVKIKKLASRLTDPRIKFADLPQRSGLDGIGIAPKRLAMEKANGDLVAFLDADNEWMPDHLERAVEVFDRDKATELVYCDSVVRMVKTPWGSTQLERIVESVLFQPETLAPMRGEEFRWRKPDWDIEARMKLERYNYIDMSEPVIRMDRFKATGGFHSAIKTDWDLWRSLLNHGVNRFVHSDHIGLILRAASLKQHRQLFLLSQIHSLGFPFDMRRHEEGREAERQADYIAKHGA